MRQCHTGYEEDDGRLANPAWHECCRPGNRRGVCSLLEKRWVSDMMSVPTILIESLFHLALFCDDSQNFSLPRSSLRQICKLYLFPPHGEVSHFMKWLFLFVMEPLYKRAILSVK